MQMLSDFFFIVNSSIAIFALTSSLILSLITILLVIGNRQFHTLNNLLLCNTSVTAIFYSIVDIIAYSLTYREDWSFNAPLCSFRAYCATTTLTNICYSKVMLAISHLFSTVFYRHRSLLTCRVHQMLIVLGWIISILITIPPFLIDDGYALERESRLCIIPSKKYRAGLFTAVASYSTPLITITLAHLKILHHVRQSTRRVQPILGNGRENLSNIRNKIRQNRREIKLIKQTVIETTLVGIGGSLYIFLLIWHASQQQSPPEILYPLSFTMIAIFVFIMSVIQFLNNNKVKRAAVQKLFPHY